MYKFNSTAFNRAVTAFFFLALAACGPFFDYLPENRPYFWKLKKGGKTSYMLGSLHYYVSLYDLPCSDKIVSALKTSDILFTELGDTSQDQVAGVNREEWHQTLNISPGGRDFKSLNALSQNFLIRHNINTELNYDRLSSEVYWLCMKEALRGAAFVSIDYQAENLAHRARIPVKALDTLALRRPTNRLSTAQDLELQIKHHHICVGSVRSRLSDYKRGGFVSDSYRGPPDNNMDEYNTIMLKNRNESWFKQIKSAWNSHNQVFIVAGNYHFTKDFNLIDMFKEEGFKVRRLSCLSGDFTSLVQ